jgi:GcrA cell cycle regulator
MDVIIWDDERMGRLERLYEEGLSFSLIADALGISRNAAIGKARRMSLPKRSESTQTKPPVKPKATARPPPRQRPPPKRPVMLRVLPDPNYYCSINDLEDCSCRYPLWESDTPHPGRRYCGFPTASVAAGVPYCRRHARMAMTHRL